MSSFLAFALTLTASDFLAFKIIFDSHSFSSKANNLSSLKDQNSPIFGWLLLEITSDSHFFFFETSCSSFLEDQNSRISVLPSLLKIALYTKPSSKFTFLKMCIFFVSRL